MRFVTRNVMELLDATAPASLSDHPPRSSSVIPRLVRGTYQSLVDARLVGSPLSRRMTGRSAAHGLFSVILRESGGPASRTLRDRLVVGTTAELLLAPSPAAAVCTVQATPVAFGVMNLGGQTYGKGAVTVDCDAAASFTVGLASGSGSERAMTGPGGAKLGYRLYRDATHAVEWGDGSGSPAVGGTSDGRQPVKLTIYGVIPFRQSVPEGAYADALLVTLAF